MDIKLRKAQLSKIIQSGEYAFLGKCAGPLIKVYTDLTKKAFVPLATIEYAPTIDGTIQKKKKKMLGEVAVRAGKRITLWILNEDMKDIIRIIISLKHPGVLINRVTEK